MGKNYVQTSNLFLNLEVIFKKSKDKRWKTEVTTMNVQLSFMHICD